MFSNEKRASFQAEIVLLLLSCVVHFKFNHSYCGSIFLKKITPLKAALYVILVTFTLDYVVTFNAKVIARTLLEFRIFIRIFILDTPLFFFAELLIFHQHCTQISNYGTILRVYFPFISLYIDRFAGRSPHVVPPWAAPCCSLALTVVTGAYLPVDTSIKVWYYLYPVIPSVSTK